MVYHDADQVAAMIARSPQDAYKFGAGCNDVEDYQRYAVTPALDGIVPNESGNVIVLPETHAHLAAWFTRATVLIWWLSADNGLQALAHSRLSDLRRVHHAYQSEYARSLIDALQLGQNVPLGDYTVDLSEYAEPLAERDNLVLFHATPHKVSADLDAIAEAVVTAAPTAQCIKITGGLTRPQIASLYARSKVYVDLGCFPGRDRGPREAASMGCHVVRATLGAGGEIAGYDVGPNLVEDIVALLEQPPVRSELIASEMQTFALQVQRTFRELAQ